MLFRSLAVSIAAQIATLPVTLYIFHQFPNYFLLTNLVVVPLSSVIIYTGILLMAVGPIGVVAFFVAKVLVFLIWLLNTSIHFIEELPGSVTTGIFISSLEMQVLYMVIITGFLYLTFRHVRLLFACMIAVALVLSLMLVTRIERLNDTRMLVFNEKRIGMLEFTYQDRAVIFYGSHKPEDGQLFSENISAVKADIQAHGIKVIFTRWAGNITYHTSEMSSFLPVFVSWPFIRAGNTRIIILDRKIPPGLKTKLAADFVILSGNPKVSVSSVMKIFKPSAIIIDATNSKFNIYRWLKDADKQHVECRAVTLEGAFEKEL